MAFTIALLGGESTGKSTLATDLQRHLVQRCGVAAEVVPEQLRAWCSEMGRAPLAHEQRERARDQMRGIEAAQQTPAVELVITDTTALTIAVYSELYFQDRSLLEAARQAQRRIDLTLLMGLDLPWVPDGLFRDSPAVRQATDALLRRELALAGIAFETVYGHGAQRLRTALRAIAKAWGRPLLDDDPSLLHGHGRWQCERCSDPDCEHRLFSGLLARQGAR